MIGIGISCLSAAKLDVRGHSIVTYNKARIAWSVTNGGGAQQFSNAFVTGPPPALSISIPAAAPPVVVTVPLVLATQTVPLADTGADAQGAIVPVSFYTGAVPAGQWPTAVNTGGGASASINVLIANTTIVATIPLWTCSNSQVGTPAGCGSSKNPCTGHNYFQTFSFLSAANMHVVLPASCSSGPCSPSQLIASGCSLQYKAGSAVGSACAATAAQQTAAASTDPRRPSIAVSLAQYNTGCSNTGGSVQGPTAVPTFSVRSAADPYQVASDLTGCSTNFGPTAKQLRVSGVGLLIVRVPSAHG